MQRREKGPRIKTIGFATFENRIVPDFWVRELRTNDAIIVPSFFNYDLFKSLKRPIFRIPHCLDFGLYRPDCPKLLQSNGKFRFLFIGQWKERKGIKELLEAWKFSFSTKKEIDLTIKTDEVSQAEVYLSKLFGNDWKDKCPNIIFTRNHLSDEQMPSYIRSFDCVVLPSWGEGFGLVGLQAMALGIPVITTNYSGQTDYAKTDTAWLIEPNGFRKITHVDSYAQFTNGEWPIIDSIEIVKQMQKVLDSPTEVKQKAENGINFVRQNFTYDIVVDAFRKILNKLKLEKV